MTDRNRQTKNILEEILLKIRQLTMHCLCYAYVSDNMRCDNIYKIIQYIIDVALKSDSLLVNYASLD